MLPLHAAMLPRGRGVVAPLLRAGLHTSARAALPRVRRTRPEPARSTGEENARATRDAPPAAPASVPWFMEEEVVDVPEPAPSAHIAPPVAWIPPYLPATTDLPPAVANLIDLCVAGPLHGLVGRPADLRDVDEEQWGAVVRASPISVIRPMPGAEEVVPEGSQDWILVVEVRGESVGAVRHVATEIGAYVRLCSSPSSNARVRRRPIPTAHLR